MKAVLFDMDGVLIDSEIPSFERLRKTLASKGVSLSLEELLERYTGMHSVTIHQDLIDTCGFGQTAEEFRQEHRQLNGSYYLDGKLDVMPGLREFLALLSGRGVQIAVVSSTASRDVLAVLNRLALLKYCDAVVCGDHVSHVKPHPEGYLTAARLLGVEPGDCLVVEDSPIGIQAAKNAAIPVVGFKGSAHVQDTSSADVQVASYDEMEQWMTRQRLI